VLVSAVVRPGGTCGELLAAVREGEVAELVACPRLLSELAGVIERPKFRRWISLDEAARYVQDLAELARTGDDPANVLAVSRDGSDDYLIAFAQAEEADALVTGDPDLLDLPNPAVPVLSPRVALDVSVQLRWGEGGIHGFPSNRSTRAVMAGTPFLRVVER
jgi:putative PIN family toxin of toxin-antitoxin system